MLESLRPPRETSSPRKSPVPISAMKASLPRTLTAFVDLPPEIHLEILCYFSYPTILSLRGVNRYFHALIAPEILSHMRTIYFHYLYRLPHSPLSASSAPCLACLRIRERCFFDISNWDLASEAMHHRVCVECRIRTVAYSRGEVFWWKKELTRCGRCGKIRPRERCTKRCGGICRQCDDWHLVRKWSRHLRFLPRWAGNLCRYLRLCAALSGDFLLHVLIMNINPLGVIMVVVQPKKFSYIGTIAQAAISVAILVGTSLLYVRNYSGDHEVLRWAIANVSRYLPKMSLCSARVAQKAANYRNRL